MLEQKTITRRMTQKIDTTANWEKATNFIPLKGEIIVYQDEDKISKIKIGDGVTLVNDLKFIDNEYANALKGYAEGESVILTDISPLEHEIKVKLNIPQNSSIDFTAVTLTKCGKNLFNPNVAITPSKVLNRETGEPQNWGAGWGITDFLPIDEMGLKVGLTYTANYHLNVCNYPLGLYDENKQMISLHCGIYEQRKDTSVFTIPENCKYIRYSVVLSNIQQVMVVLGNYPTQNEMDLACPFEEYKEPVSYTPNSDGTVDGVKSLYPTTALVTDTENVTITAEYIKNVNEALGVEPSDDDASSLVVGANITDVLRYTKQDLTDAQKAQTIENLGLTEINKKLEQKIDISGIDQITPENAAFIKKTLSFAQMLDLSSFEKGKKISDTYGDDINNLVDNEYYSTSNIIDFDDENRKTIAININKNFFVCGYLKNGNSYVRHAMVNASGFTQVGDHWEYTFTNNIVKLRLCIQNGILATVENTLLMTYADEWENATVDYGINYKLSKEIKLYESFEGKKFCGIGDSIMQGSGDAVGGFLGVLQEQYPSISVHNMGVGSTTMAQNASVPANASNKCILDRIDDIPDGQDYIILEGGLNDFFHSSTYSIPFGEYESNINMIPQNARWNETAKAYANLTTLYSYGMEQSTTLDTTTFCGAFEAALAKLIIRFYDKKYGVVIPHNPRSTIDIDAYLDAEVRLCAKYGVPCLDLRKVAGMPRIRVIAGKADGTSVFTIDAVHPNHEGYLKRYLPPLISWLKTL